MVELRHTPESPITILIAEDEEPVRNLLARSLWDEGYRTLEARDGGMALHMARLARPHLHLVITDIVMPNLDGRQLGKLLAIECPEVPIIYISAFPPGDLFSRDGPAGSRFLQKPFSTEELQDAVRACLSARHSQRTGQPSA
jgi:two-component system, cell cycle sensor histidine kinase and response regulator CckA